MLKVQDSMREDKGLIMMKITSAMLFLLICGLIFAQTTIDYNAPMPVDPDLVIGKLPNGLTYYIKENHKPEHRAELRLVENVGSVQEDADQQGLAHFTEHMAFRGTTHFPKMAMTDFLDSLGMGFGNELNGYTTFDQTAYMFQFPTENQEHLRKALRILSDWASGISFETDILEIERGVLVEEWRGGQGAQQRIFDKQRAVLFAGSQYAKRMPIGKVEVLQSFKPDIIKRFYHDWYRPDLQAVVAVGDFDAKQMEQMIKDSFGSIPKVENPRPVITYEIPDHDSVKVVIATDKEASYSQVALNWKHDRINNKTLSDFRQSALVYLFTNMLDKRLEELSKLPDPPFSYVYNYDYNALRSKSNYIMAAFIPEKGVLKAVTALMTEAQKAKRYSFTQAELGRAKQNIMREAEQILAEKDKQESGNLVWNYIENFSNEGPLIDIEQTISLYNVIIDSISMDDINQVCRELITDNNLVVTVSGPDKQELQYPTEAEILTAINLAAREELISYDDRVRTENLFDVNLKPRFAKSEKQYKNLGLKEWKLSNGVKVLLKQTDFMNDEVLLQAYSPGGYNLYSLEDKFTASSAAEAVKDSGVGIFDATTLVKKLTGKIADITPYIYDSEEGFTGNCSKLDLETMFQLIYLYATSPRLDEESFTSWKARTKSWLDNTALNPRSCFNDSVTATLYNHHPRAREMKVQDLEKIEWRRMLEIYQDRFSDFSDFTFVIVGNFDEKILKDYCEKYLANLPSKNRKEKMIDTGMRYAQDINEIKVYKGQDEKSTVEFYFNGSCKVNARTDFECKSLSSLLNEKLMDNIREARGGVYAIYAWDYETKYPIPSYLYTIFMQCAPDKAEELSIAVIGTLDSLKAGLISEKYVNVVKTTKQKQLETDLKDNNWWKERIYKVLQNNYPLNSILSDEKLINDLNLKKMQKTAKTYLNYDTNLVRGILYPEARPKDIPAKIKR